jgi:orotate phosphoribosyltransferase
MKDVRPFFESGAVGISRPDAIRFRQGMLSPGAYINNRKLPSHPREWDEVMSKVMKRAEDLYGFDAIASVASGGVLHGGVLAWKMTIPHFIVKKEEKKTHGFGGLIDGDASMLEGRGVLLVEDMSSTFKSSLRAIGILEDAGATVAHTLLLNTWGFPEFHENIRGYSVHAICTGEMIVDYAAQSGIIDKSHEGILRHWLENPWDQEWSRDGWKLPEQASG